MGRSLHTFEFGELKKALSTETAFLLRIGDGNKIAVSWWVSAKRTRSYPYARVYDSLGYSGRKATIIPIVKDEGKNGDRDFLQWDTVSLMSLLGVYVIISYYKEASKSHRYENKITNQRYNVSHIKEEVTKLLSYQSDALHWNLSQLEKAGEIAQMALDAYSELASKLRVEMHSSEAARRRIKSLLKGKEAFIGMSRELARRAQTRESVTEQPKEKLRGTKGTITITNYLGGKYFFTSDEVELHGNDLHLIEGKHTNTNKLPSVDDMKDGLLRMILLTNLEDARINGDIYKPFPVLKLTTGSGFRAESMNRAQRGILEDLMKESETNNFSVSLNSRYL